MSLKGLLVGTGALFTLLGSSMNANAISPAEEFGIRNRLEKSGIEQRVEPSENDTSFVNFSNELGDMSERYKVPIKKTYKPFKPEDMMWDETTFTWSESVNHINGSEELDEIYSGKGTLIAKYRGILDDVNRESDWGKWDRFFWVPTVGVELLMAASKSKLNNPNPDENDEPQQIIKTHITWPLHSDWRYYLKKNLYCSLLFRHKSYDQPKEDEVDVDRFMTENPGSGIVEQDLNIVSHTCAYKSSEGRFDYQIRGLLNSWQAAPHPIVILESHYKSSYRENYPNRFATDGRMSYKLSDNTQAYVDFQIEFPSDLFKNENARVPTNVSFNIGWGMFKFFYEMSRGRPDGLIVPNGFTTDSNNNRFGLKLAGVFGSK